MNSTALCRRYDQANRADKPFDHEEESSRDVTVNLALDHKPLVANDFNRDEYSCDEAVKDYHDCLPVFFCISCRH